jgi:hypothetical protein
LEKNLRRFVLCVAALSLFPLTTSAQEQPTNTALIGELMAFHGSKAIVDAMTTHCYENTGLDPVYKDAAANWYLRNISYLDLADRVINRLGGAAGGQQLAAETYGGSQIMSAYNQAGDKDVFCKTFLEQVQGGALDIDKQLPSILKQAQEISAG